MFQEYEPHHWSVERRGLRYIVKKIAWADFAGTAYRWARDSRGRVRRFWTRKGAQSAADLLNAGAE